MPGKKILVVSAHPDDEVLGCGATIRKHVDAGDDVSVVFMADGIGSRRSINQEELIEKREKNSINACSIIGVKNPFFFRLPDNRMDAEPFLDIVYILEEVINKFRPQIIYTHHGGDLNVDHRITHQAVITCCRPVPGSFVREIYSFEVPSSTEWSSPAMGGSFEPTVFVDISEYLEAKIQALKAYEGELLEFPHSRSFKAIEALARWRGASVGCLAAEAFRAERIVKSP
jgi:N-acetylglucosamine malate deacetylase 1